MRHAIFAASLLVALVLATPVHAQVGGARGKVVDEEGEPIAGATVKMQYLEGMTREYEVQTNENGEFIQVGLMVGQYSFTASKEGYQPKASQARVGLGIATDIAPFKLMSMEAAAAQPREGEAEVREKFAEGVRLTGEGQYAEAEAAFMAVLDIHAGIPEVHRNLGFLYAKQQKWEKAEASYQAALDLRPGDPDFLAALAKVYQESGQEEKAMNLIQQAAADNPEDATAQFNQGIFLLTEGQNEPALAAFEAALAADPALAEAHYYVGTLLVGQGKVPEAVEHLEAYIAASPDNPENVATAKGLVEALKQ